MGVKQITKSNNFQFICRGNDVPSFNDNETIVYVIHELNNRLVGESVGEGFIVSDVNFMFRHLFFFR